MWEIDGGAAVTDAEVVARISRGELRGVTKVRPVDGGAWQLLGAHEPFAVALEQRRPSALRAQATGFVGTLLVLAVALAAWFAVGGKVAIFKAADGYGRDSDTRILLP